LFKKTKTTKQTSAVPQLTLILQRYAQPSSQTVVGGTPHLLAGGPPAGISHGGLFYRLFNGGWSPVAMPCPTALSSGDRSCNYRMKWRLAFEMLALCIVLTIFVGNIYFYKLEKILENLLYGQVKKISKRSTHTMIQKIVDVASCAPSHASTGCAHFNSARH
jgi:hypothetical protein